MKNLRLSIGIMMILVVCLFITYGVGIQNQNSQKPDKSEVTQTENSQSEEETITATLAVCGDIMTHMPLTNDAWSDEKNAYDYAPMLAGSVSWVQSADYAVANLETTFAGGPNYSGYPAFNAPDDLAKELKESGFDLVLTSNNHSMDRGYNGLTRTLDVLDYYGIKHVGTYRTQQERDTNNGIVVADVGGLSVAFLGYTYGTNGIPVADDKLYSVNIFNTDYMTNASQLDTEKIKADMQAARNLNADFIAVMIHWGIEYKLEQNEYQEQIAQFLFDEGADIILGGHPHVLQPMELYTKTDENGEEEQGFVCYSLGNYISSQKDQYTDTTVVLNLELKKDSDGKAEVSGFKYVPMLMVNRGSEAENRYQLIDCYASLTAGEESEEIREKMQQAINDCHMILGEQTDYTKIA